MRLVANVAPPSSLAAADGFAPPWRTLTIKKGEHITVGLLLEAAVSGTVVNASGEPVSAAWVSVGYEDDDGAFGMLESFAGGQPWTNTEGAFRLFGLIPDVPITLQAEASKGAL